MILGSTYNDNIYHSTIVFTDWDEFNISSLLSPHGVLNIVSVEGNEEAENGEEHDGVGCENKATGSSSDLKERS